MKMILGLIGAAVIGAWLGAVIARRSTGIDEPLVLTSDWSDSIGYWDEVSDEDGELLLSMSRFPDLGPAKLTWKNNLPDFGLARLTWKNNLPNIDYFIGEI